MSLSGGRVTLPRPGQGHGGRCSPHAQAGFHPAARAWKASQGSGGQAFLIVVIFWHGFHGFHGFLCWIDNRGSTCKLKVDILLIAFL